LGAAPAAATLPDATGPIVWADFYYRRTRRLRGGYGLIAALIAVVYVETLTTVGTKLSATSVPIAGSL
jgi:hypothetical protein